MKSSEASLEQLRDAQELGHETRLDDQDHLVLKLWLRLLSCTTQIETEIRRRLRVEFGISLARFDYMAQLYRYQEGLKMRDLSRCLMVTGGNVTGLTDELQGEGLVVREHSPADRRSWIIRLTPKGRKNFAIMAERHEAWLHEMLGEMNDKSATKLYEHLGQLRAHIAASDSIVARIEPPPAP